MVDSATPRELLTGISCRRALFLQGPMGPFFRRMREQLRQLGIECAKVNFNAGDDLFDSGPEVIAFRGRLDEWPDFLEDLIRHQRFDAIFLFGDGRFYHQKAITRAKALGVPVYVFEEGYLRPHFLTLEEGGVNGYSSLPRDPAAYRIAQRSKRPTGAAPPLPTPGRTFRYAAWYSTLYTLALTYKNGRYPHYRHHRPMHAASEAVAWVKAGIRKLYYQAAERKTFDYLTHAASTRFFLVPLQVYCDYQLKHSDFPSVEDFISFIAAQFAEHAPPDTELVLKHHPLDRGYTNYAGLVAQLREKHGLAGRLHYIHDLHLPTLLRHARGCITINSTVGLTAVHYGVPTKVLGVSVYDMEGLTSQAPLDAYFKAPGRVDKELYRHFRRWLLQHNQARGSFYRKLPGVSTPSGVLWPPRLNLPERAPSETLSKSGTPK